MAQGPTQHCPVKLEPTTRAHGASQTVPHHSLDVHTQHTEDTSSDPAPHLSMNTTPMPAINILLIHVQHLLLWLPLVMALVLLSSLLMVSCCDADLAGMEILCCCMWTGCSNGSMHTSKPSAT